MERIRTAVFGTGFVGRVHLEGIRRLGGVWTEALRDVAVIPLPTDAAQVAEGIRSLRGADLLSGGRGGEPFDIDAVADLTARLGALLLERGLLLIELNPVVVHRHGCVAVDAVARGL